MLPCFGIISRPCRSDQLRESIEIEQSIAQNGELKHSLGAQMHEGDVHRAVCRVLATDWTDPGRSVTAGTQYLDVWYATCGHCNPQCCFVSAYRSATPQYAPQRRSVPRPGA